MISNVRYTTLDFKLEFESPVFFDIYPSFVLRSVLGKYLREMHCVCRGTRCQECPFCKTCAYAFIFETPIDKNSSSLSGRDRAGHPFRIIAEGQPGEKSRSLTFRFQLIGKGIEFIPHVVFAFREAGKSGLFRQRVRYRIAAITCGGEPVLEGDRIKAASIFEQHETYNDSIEAMESKKLVIVCRTPLRFKTSGHYTPDFQAEDFLDACRRRATMLCEFYGEPSLSNQNDRNLREPNLVTSVSIFDRKCRWVDYIHWSARQKKTMLLGGSLGSFSIRGKTFASCWQALGICTALGAGKNTSFGFGDISVNEKSE